MWKLDLCTVAPKTYLTVVTCSACKWEMILYLCRGKRFRKYFMSAPWLVHQVWGFFFLIFYVLHIDVFSKLLRNNVWNAHTILYHWCCFMPSSIWSRGGNLSGGVFFFCSFGEVSLKGAWSVKINWLVFSHLEKHKFKAQFVLSTQCSIFSHKILLGMHHLFCSYFWKFHKTVFPIS